MFKLVRLLLASQLTIVLLAPVLLWQGWMLVRPKPFPLDARRRLVAVEAAGRLAESMPKTPNGKRTLVVARFEDDPTGSVTEAVRVAIDRVGRYAVRPTTATQNAFEQLGVGEKPFALEDAPSIRFEGLDSDYVLAGRVGSLYSRSDDDKAVLEAVLVAANGSFEPLLLSAESSRDHRQNFATSAILSYPWPTRLASWLVLALLLPLVFAPLAGRGLQRESNAVNLGMLIGLTLVASLAAYAVLGFQLQTALTATLLTGAAALAGVYNWCVLSKLEDLRN